MRGDPMRRIIHLMVVIGTLIPVGCSTPRDTASLKEKIHEYAEKGDAQGLQRILKEHPDLVNCVYDEASGDLPIHRATKRGHLVALNVLLEAGADIQAKNNASFATPLQVAAGRGNAEIIERLLKAGASIQ